MNDRPFFYLIKACLLKKGVLPLLLFILLSAEPTPGQTSFLHSINVSSYPDNPGLVSRVERSQRILKALFLEQRYQYREARNIWESMPGSSKPIEDHIFLNELIESESLELNAVPQSLFSTRMAASYLKWQKQWSKAYQLLSARPALVAQNEELQFIQVLMALYLRKYEDARKQLQAMGDRDTHDQIQLTLLWSWYYTLSERQAELKDVLGELEENAFYYPTSFVISESVEYPWHELKENALRALIRFPSDKELIERIVVLFSRHEAVDELSHVLEFHERGDTAQTAWIMQADILLSTQQFIELKQLLGEVQPEEEHRIEYLNYQAQVAIFEQNWQRLKRIAEVYRSQFPFLQDGDLFMSIYEDSIAPSQKDN